MHDYKRPIQKLELDIDYFKRQLASAKLQQKMAKSSGAKLLAQRLNTRIKYFSNRISASEKEVKRLKALYNMNADEQAVARLIPANEFKTEATNV